MDFNDYEIPKEYKELSNIDFDNHIDKHQYIILCSVKRAVLHHVHQQSEKNRPVIVTIGRFNYFRN